MKKPSQVRLQLTPLTLPYLTFGVGRSPTLRTVFIRPNVQSRYDQRPKISKVQLVNSPVN